MLKIASHVSIKDGLLGACKDRRADIGATPDNARGKEEIAFLRGDF